MKVQSKVELEDWEEGWLRFDSNWTDGQIAELRKGSPTHIESAKQYLEDRYLDAEDQYARDSFKAGWEACILRIREQERREAQANAH